MLPPRSMVPVDSIFNATAVTIDACYSQCGTGQESFDWAVFSQDFAAWLLPYLALISQLPFGARHQVDNLMSALLTVGSPTLAGYSLFLTLLNARWINQQFDSIDFPRRKLRETVVDVLSSLQQVPLRVYPGEAAFLESLVILPQNDNWWTTLSDSLNYTHSWSISSATAIAWVVIAYLLTVADSLSNVADHINSNGQGTGSAWLWLLPVVVGWLVLAPKCAYGRVQHAFEQANQHIVVADAERNALKPNSGITIVSWSRSAYITSLLYRSAWSKAQRQIRVDGSAGWQTVPNSRAIHETNRQGNRAQVVAYSSLVTLGLQWGTTGAAVLAVRYTPTTRLGCRSLAYIIYGAASTISWFLLVLSSLLANYATPPSNASPTQTVTMQLTMALSNNLRWAGKALAGLNAAFIITISVFQYANFYDRCYCNSSVLSRGSQAYDIVVILYSDVALARGAWIGALVLASMCSLVFVVIGYPAIPS
ncbi:hypothetical protein HYDPIDRAFT_181885 [Hydnomerulius pinastri MD-312]|uniref:Uncharacterized protein n=1 Tax=Hydnomerulius pinastri MD-312 TaxID=994086 RepID=A0A0C9WET6_9AGAM|nr:hypothetical protein HYDPIDRAFT_181885 [Hydnomerulius pinastri MD-312]